MSTKLWKRSGVDWTFLRSGAAGKRREAVMDKCDRFERIQIMKLLGEASSAEQRFAEDHAEDCVECRRSASRDRWLEAAFDVNVNKAHSGFSSAHRGLMESFRDKRAYCGQLEGPFGTVFLAATERGLCRVSFKRTEEDFLAELERRALLPERSPKKVAREVRELEAYFDGRCKYFKVPIDLRLVTPFQRRVLEATATVPFGKVVSYSDIARQIGQPEARRAVGGALGKNPVAIVVPCHRVIAANGNIGGYTGGLDIKRELMRIEGIHLEKE
jgi:methylated-DNA-[protein]-cysteine S-methyltransferase